MEFEVHNLQKFKLGVHIAQGFLIFVSWAVEIAVFRSSASIDGRPGWYFGLCFLTIPAIIYLTMTPRFPRARKFANPYALVAVDAIYTILWLSAFSAQASFNSSGKCKGGCGLSKAIVGLGVFIWLLWILTTAMSVYGAVYYRREGYLPGASRAPFNAQQIDPDKDAFSTAPHDDEYAPIHNADEEHEIPNTYAGPSGSMGSRFDGGDTSPPVYSGGYVPPHVSEDTGYTGYSGAAPVSSGPGGRVQFPDARYDNI